MNKYYIDDYDKYFWEKYEDKRQLSDIEQIELEIDLDRFFKFCPKHKEIMLLHADGYTLKEIVLRTGVTINRVRRIIDLYAKNQ